MASPFPWGWQVRAVTPILTFPHQRGKGQSGALRERGRACFRLPGAPRTVSREQPAPAPNSGPTAIALRSPYRSANVPRTAQRTPRWRPLAHIRSIRSPVPRKKRHSPAPPVPGPAPSNPTHAPPIPVSAQFLPTKPPQSRNFATALEPYAHPCYPRPREGPTPRPGNPVPTRGKAPGIRRGVENWPPATDHRPAPCPTLSHGATLVSQ